MVRVECPCCSGAGEAYYNQGNRLVFGECPVCHGAGTAREHTVHLWLTSAHIERLKVLRDKRKKDEELDG